MASGRFAYWTRLAHALSISRRELTWAALVACLVMLLTFIPYLYGWAMAPPEMVYTGYVFEYQDHAVHSAWVRQAQMGRLLFEDLFTTEPQSPHFFNLYFLLLGRLARVLHLSVVTAEQLGRVVFGWAFLVLVYAFAAQFTQSVFTRRLALLLTALSSGLGWLVNPRLPEAQVAAVNPLTWAMDYVPAGKGLIMPEAISFPSLMIYGLFAVSYFLLAAALYLLWLAWQRGSWRLALWAGLAAMALANVHSYDIITVWAVGAVAWALLAVAQRRVPRREFAMLAAVMALSALPVLHQYYVFSTSEVFRAKANTPTLSPPFHYETGRTAAGYLRGEAQYLLTMGLCAVAALPAIAHAVRRRRADWLYLAAWAVAPFALVYLPVAFQRKLAHGMHVPVCMLAALAIGDLALLFRVSARRAGRAAAREISSGRQWRAAALFLALVVPSNVGLMGLTLTRLREDAAYRASTLGRGHSATVDARDLYPSYYLHEHDLEAMRWLAAHSAPGDAVLALPAVGLYLPRVAGRFTYLGHWAETLNVRWKMTQVLRFFGAEMEDARGEAVPPLTDAERLDLARANRIRYVYFGYAEQAVARVTPQQMQGLELAYRNPRVEIYRFETGAD